MITIQAINDVGKGPAAVVKIKTAQGGKNSKQIQRVDHTSSTDKQRICVITQLKSSKKKFKLNACVPKGNSFERYAIICDVIAYHLVHFFSIRVIHKCQSGIDFFLQACTQ